MNAQTSSITATTIESASRTVRTDTECRARASEFLTELIGSPPDSLSWDDAHHLQGHGHVNGCELIVIAPRDDQHHTVVLTADDWAAVRRSNSDTRRALIDECAIVDHDRLVDVLHHRNHWSAPLIAAA